MAKNFGQSERRFYASRANFVVFHHDCVLKNLRVLIVDLAYLKMAKKRRLIYRKYLR
jgi:hypothetical protein